MGVSGSNESFTQNGTHCTEEKGTLGALVSDGTSLYVLGPAHVLALGTSGYLSSGSGEPIVQPSLSILGTSPLNLISCPPTASQLAPAQVATLSTVVPIVFNGSAQNTYDAALAKLSPPGSATSSINGISAFSGTLVSPVNKGLMVQKVGPTTGLTEGKVTKILKVAKYKICARTPTSNNACGEATIKFGVHIVVTPVHSASFDAYGDSGAMVLSTGSCPQPVGMVVGGDPSLSKTFVAPFAATGSVPGVLQALQTAAGSGSASLAIVPGGAGCTATGQAEIVNSDGSTSPVDATVADTDVAQALNVLPDFLSSSPLSGLMTGGLVDGVAIDFSTSPASLDVTADDGTINGESEADFVENQMPSVFEGVPVEVTTVDTIDLTNAAATFP
jgi:hypothetical protein